MFPTPVRVKTAPHWVWSTTPPPVLPPSWPGSGHAAEIAEKLRPVLAACGIPGDRFVSYFAFAQKRGRGFRDYSGRTLETAAADLIDLYEAKSLDRDTLRAIAAALFGLTDLA